MSGKLTGAVLAAVLGRASAAVIAGAMASETARLQQILAGEPADPTARDLARDRAAADGLLSVTAARAGGAARLTLAAPGLFAREFGALDQPANPVLGPAIEAFKRRSA